VLYSSEAANSKGLIEKDKLDKKKFRQGSREGVRREEGFRLSEERRECPAKRNRRLRR